MPMPHPDRELFEQYGEHYRQMETGERLPDDLTRLKRDRLPPWIDEVPKDARILDAGCAEGHWLEALRRVGFINLTGVDLSSQLIACAKQRLGDHANLIQADLLEWLPQIPDASYDIIFFHDVLEHLPRDKAIEVLRQFHRILVPRGRLQVRVPNMASLLGAFCMAIDFTHVTHFTEYSLLQVLVVAGFERGRIEFVCQAPRLFWNPKQPQRMLLRLLNRLRWHLNNTVNASFYVLADFIRPTVFDPNLLVLAKK